MKPTEEKSKLMKEQLLAEISTQFQEMRLGRWFAFYNTPWLMCRGRWSQSHHCQSRAPDGFSRKDTDFLKHFLKRKKGRYRSATVCSSSVAESQVVLVHPWPGVFQQMFLKIRSELCKRCYFARLPSRLRAEGSGQQAGMRLTASSRKPDRRE